MTIYLEKIAMQQKSGYCEGCLLHLLLWWIAAPGLTAWGSFFEVSLENQYSRGLSQVQTGASSLAAKC
jgi:hypothetical protein